MARKARKHLQYCMHHVMLRGNNKCPIFFNDKHRHLFYHYLEQSVEKFDCKIHLFCLMTNHVHLVIETKLIPLSKIMQSITSGYTLKINRLEARTGHLFQGRFKSKLVSSVRYLAELCFYIHYNPIAANIVKNMDDYPWSSHRCYTKISSIQWLTLDLINKVYDVIGAEDYNDFMRLKILAKDNIDMTFYETHTINLSSSLEKQLNPTIEILPEEVTLDRIIETTCKMLTINPKHISSISLERNICRARNITSYIAHYYAGYQIKTIAAVFQQQARCVGQAMHRFMRKKSAHSDIERALALLNENNNG